MSETIQLIQELNKRFRTCQKADFNKESGITHDSSRPVKRVGYCTNLTPQTVKQASIQGIDLMLTHHDAWDFIFGLKEKCRSLLEEHGISHYFNHAPLDDCEFGTNSSLVREMSWQEVKKTCETDGYMAGVIARPPEGTNFETIAASLEKLLEEKVLAWKFHRRPITKAFIVCGAGHLTSDMQEAVEEGCDLYITGEKILYTLEYAQLHRLNLIVGSHTFIELFGVKSMAKILHANHEELQIERINEEHLETGFFK